MKNGEHLTDDLLIRELDDDLAGSKGALVASHLAECHECRQRYHEWSALSVRIEGLVGHGPVEHVADEREWISAELAAREGHRSRPEAADNVLRRFGIGIAVAAGLTALVMFLPNRKNSINNTPASAALTRTADTFEVGSETFIALPYSNPDLPLTAPHIVRMQVPLMSLADAGVVFEPVSSAVSSSDESLLADVLLGMDGQPVGVHLLGRVE